MKIPDGLVIAIVGPPASGKSTMAPLVAQALEGRCISREQLVSVGRRDGWLDASGIDQSALKGLDPHHDHNALLLVRAAVRHRALQREATPVVLDNVVSDAATLDVVAAMSTRPRLGWLRILELDAAQMKLLSRALQPFCPTCRTTEVTGPEGWGPVADRQPVRCDMCGERLVCLNDQGINIFQRRLERYHLDQRDPLLAAARQRSIRWRRVETRRPPAELLPITVEGLTTYARRPTGPAKTPTQRQPNQ